MKIERELMRGAGPVAVLKMLSRCEMYGYELVEELSKRSAGVLEMGQSTLYPMLYNLEAKGLIAGSWRVEANGRKRKYYALTGKGKKRLAKDVKEWGAVVKAMVALGVIGGEWGGEGAAHGGVVLDGKAVPA